ncbi:hypothetical protein [Neorhodopirellula pilleata]|uniref:Uncharacterized protein n=1 Tax=Neorhodopirellula pilleata TaxID=2714738 RepID=A0A5C6A399_9BACT|nr:hypothetical protein [Neorhodopirellula pilleata]TWT93728.1 hypothetical protein Pla100_42460 [Neorhodopirellula pilleata]
MRSILASPNFRQGIQLVLLVVLMWVGPVPIGHNHSTAMDSRSSDLDLAQHVLLHHCGGVSNEIDCHWHLHWVFRGAGYAGINGEASVVQAMSSRSEVANALPDHVDVDASPTGFVDDGLSRPLEPVGRTLAGMNWRVGHADVRLLVPTISMVMRC